MAYAPPPALLEAAARLALRVGPLPAALGQGRHRTRRRGQAVEFSEHRAYVPGDDPRRIDWRALAKSDRLLTRQGEDEARLGLEIVLDASGSMGFGTAPVRAELACDLVAGLALVALRQGDRVGLTAQAGHADAASVPARAGMPQLAALCACLGQLRPAGPTVLPAALTALAERRVRGTTSVVVSDLWTPVPALAAALALLSARRVGVAVVHLVDPAEQRFDFAGPTAFVGMEGEGERIADAATLRPTYLAALTAHRAALARALPAAGVSYHEAVSTTPAPALLAALLTPPSR